MRVSVSFAEVIAMQESIASFKEDESLSLLPMTINLTPLRLSFSISAAIALTINSISPSTSACGRFQFSSEKA